jgi:hypothetical protein
MPRVQGDVQAHRAVLPLVHQASSDEDVEPVNFLHDPPDVPEGAADAWQMAQPGQAPGGFVPGQYHQASQHLLTDFPNTQGPMYFLKLFCDDAWWAKIRDETNRFMHQLNCVETRHTTIDELKRWFGLLMIISHFNLPNLDIYWQPLNHSLPHLLHPCFRNVMSRERFSFLVSHHFRTSKWWLKAFLGIVDLALANAWVLYKHTRLASDPVPQHSQFWLEIATSLVGRHPGVMLGSAVPHSLRTFAPTDGPDGSRRKRPNCVVCKKHGLLARTTYGCVTCRVALHPECAAEWPHLADPDEMKEYVFDDWVHGEARR